MPPPLPLSAWVIALDEECLGCGGGLAPVYRGIS